MQRGRPPYPGHLQPQIPTGLGYYSLDDPGVLHNISSPLLHSTASAPSACTPTGSEVNVRREAAPEHPGESPTQGPLFPLLGKRVMVERMGRWERRSPGWSSGIARGGDVRIIDDLAELFSDDRYVKIKGHPLFLIYRAELLDEPRRTLGHCEQGAGNWDRRAPPVHGPEFQPARPAITS